MTSRAQYGALAVLALMISLDLQAGVPQERGKAEPPDRTTPILGRMTPAQRRHGRLFHGRSGKIVDKKSGVSVEQMTVGERATKPLNTVIADMACASDAVFTGTVSSLNAFPTEDGSLIFTEYSVRPTEVFRGANGAVVVTGRNVTVVRPGGELNVEGTVVKATLNLFPPLKVGDRYVLFLKYLADTGAFQTDSPEGVLRLTGTEVVGSVDLNAYDERLLSPLPADRILSVLRNATCQ
jgi:hypothetical protein